ncbi:MAG: glycerate kinase [Candidatus Dormibacteraeota bacterium]|nr:glycerate kinase [Candidatus Dormibacteraeota bacterium]
MKVVAAPTAFKGTLTPLRAADAIAAGLRQTSREVEVDVCPIADGGDGFLEAIGEALEVEGRAVLVRGPMHAPVKATYGIRREEAGTLAVVESAQAVGLALLQPGQLDPLGASSGGLGELLAEARQAGSTSFLVGLGGSASTDGGTGMARALGYRFLDGDGHELPEGGGPLERLRHIDVGGFDHSWALLEATAARDVDNPLLGPTGAAAVYAPQKGANPEQVVRLEAGLARLAEVVRADLGVDIANLPGGLPGGGAAGGLGAGMVAFLGATLVPGAEQVIEVVRLESRLAGAGLMVTGEGRLDRQSLHGKAAVTAGRRARALGVRSVCIAGSLGDGWQETVGDAFDEVVEASAIADPAAGVTAAAARLL